MNSLYQPDGDGEFRRSFPEFYAEEFGAAKRYLPERVDFAAEGRETLVRRRVLLDLPERYLSSPAA